MHPQSMYPSSHFAYCSMHRKSRIVGVVEELHRSVDDRCIERFGVIQAAKERRAYEIKQKARYVFRTQSCCFPSAPHISVVLHGYIHVWISTTHCLCIPSCVAAHTASGVVVYPAQAAEAAAAKRQSSADSKRGNARSRSNTPSASADAGTVSTEPTDDSMDVDAAVESIMEAATAPGSPSHLFGELPSSQMGPPSTAPLRRAPTQVIMSQPCHHPACDSLPCAHIYSWPCDGSVCTTVH